MTAIPGSQGNNDATIEPVFETGNRHEYERALESFRASRAKTQIDPSRTRFSLLLAPFEMPGKYLEGLVPVGWVGPFGLWALSDLPSDFVRGLEQTVVRMNGTSLMRFQKEGIPLSTGGAAELLAKAQAARAAAEASAPAPTPAPVTTSTVGPQIKGYDPKEADRPIRSDQPRPLNIKSVPGLKGICTWPDDNMDLRREREAREARAAAAKKPRLTMADYAKKAAQEKAEFQVKKAQATADHKQVLNWLVNDRNTKEADIRQRMQKRREYVRGQANRTDAVLHGPKMFIEGGWLKIHLRNRTDVSLKITIDFEVYDKKRERVPLNPSLSVLLPLVDQDLILAAWDESYASASEYRIHWDDSPGDYQGNY